jgi:hypothetical protein
MPIRVPGSSSRPDVFVSAKCAVPIPAPHPARREALIRASLDASVRRISHVASAVVAGSNVEMDVVMIGRDDGIFALDVVPARYRIDGRQGLVHRALRDLGHASLIVTAEDLDAEPARANRDLVWSHRGRTVAVDRRLEILRILVDDGPLPLDRLLRGVSGRDPAASVMALACADLLELDLESALFGPSTEVRLRA